MLALCRSKYMILTESVNTYCAMAGRLLIVGLPVVCMFTLIEIGLKIRRL